MMRLDARLLAKMLTQSYRLSGVDNVQSVAGNPACVFDDPEFQQLNPPSENGGVTFPACSQILGNGLPMTAPVVTGGQTDLVYQLTSWIASSPRRWRTRFRSPA